MTQTDRIRAIIAQHRQQPHGPIFLANAVRAQMGARASDDDVNSAIAFCREIVDAVPVLLDRVRPADPGGPQPGAPRLG